LTESLEQANSVSLSHIHKNNNKNKMFIVVKCTVSSCHELAGFQANQINELENNYT